ncbi:MAG: outer membrane lipoprotein carrier protein LolA [Candidatus Saccharicenans sp.]|jgi:outer membrane lipoprotein carrier protein|nr:outer membrane lipoprotein carrier protein LolA [Candidatus Saccharicenans sp.]
MTANLREGSNWPGFSVFLNTGWKAGCLLLLFLFGPLLGLSATLAQNLNPQEVASKLWGKLSSLTTLEADFVQYYYSTQVDEPVAGRGKVFIRRPDRMRWEYSSPERQIFLIKGELLWIYFPDEKQLIKKEANYELQAGEILGLLAGNVNLLEKYEVSASPFPTNQKDVYQIRLTPRETGQYSYLLLEIDRKSYLLSTAILFEATGGKLEYHFSRFKLNQKLRDELFEVKIPADCEIIEGD